MADEKHVLDGVYKPTYSWGAPTLYDLLLGWTKPLTSHGVEQIPLRLASCWKAVAEAAEVS